MKRNEKLLLLMHNNRRKKILIKSRNRKQKPNSFVTKAVENVGSAVVSIETPRYNRKRPPNSQLYFDPYFQRFSGLDFSIIETDQKIERIVDLRIEAGQKIVPQGSGFIFADGLVMTNAHIVNGSEKVIVGLTDGSKYNAKVIGQDFLTDLAVLKIEEKRPWPKAKLGDSSKIKVGDWAIAIGNPFGLENTVTLGIISNLNRNISTLRFTYDTKLELIQTDAAINAGNSGGPLLNSDGQVIGINTLIRSGPGAGLNFAIPINKAYSIAIQLIKNGKVIHPMIGINLIDEPNNIVKVINVAPNSPADKSGILNNDIIIKVGKKNINNSSDVINEISENGIDKFINITLKRNKKIIKLNVKPTDITNLLEKNQKGT